MERIREPVSYTHLYQYQKSDADIFADTQLNYEDSISTTYKKKYYEKSQRRLYYIKADSWYISAGTVKNDYKEWEMYTNEHQLLSLIHIFVTEHIRRIRSKLSAVTDIQYIETVWGVGYKWIG